MLKKVIYLGIVAFLIASVHSCSLNNNIITPPCKIFEADLTDRWWYPVGGKAEEGIRFASNGNCYRRHSADSLTFTLENCNKITIQNHSRHVIEMMEIVKLLPDKLIIANEKGVEKTYCLNPAL